MAHYSAELQRHLKEDHKISAFSTYLKEIVYGGNDGIVTTFAVVAGFTGAQSSTSPSFTVLTVLLFGIANLFADGASMGLGNFLSLRSEKDLYATEKKKEAFEIDQNPGYEKNETTELLVNKGFTVQQAKQLTEIYATNREYWIDFMMRYELEMSSPEAENPILTACATFFSFVFFGLIPLLPYFFMSDVNRTFIYSTFATLTALILLGLLRFRVTKESVFRSVGEIVLVGGISATIAYVVGIFFR